MLRAISDGQTSDVERRAIGHEDFERATQYLIKRNWSQGELDIALKKQAINKAPGTLYCRLARRLYNDLLEWDKKEVADLIMLEFLVPSNKRPEDA